MSKLATLTTLFAVTLAASTADAGKRCRGGGHVWKPAPAPTYPVPTYQPAPTVLPVPQTTPSVRWLFGMSVEVVRTSQGNALQIASITPGGAAARAGLEVGDLIFTSNGVNFDYARNNHAGVRQLQQSVDQSLSPAPTAPVPTVTGVSTRVVPNPGQQQAVAALQVLDHRTQQYMTIHVYPTPNFPSQPGPPAPTATF